MCASSSTYWRYCQELTTAIDSYRLMNHSALYVYWVNIRISSRGKIGGRFPPSQGACTKQKCKKNLNTVSFDSSNATLPQLWRRIGPTHIHHLFFTTYRCWPSLAFLDCRLHHLAYSLILPPPYLSQPITSHYNSDMNPNSILHPFKHH